MNNIGHVQMDTDDDQVDAAFYPVESPGLNGIVSTQVNIELHMRYVTIYTALISI
jgi:hypothetical protein